MIVSGIVLIVAGLLSWASGFDLWLHPLVRLAPTSRLLWSAAHLTTIGSFLVMGPLAVLVAIALYFGGRSRMALWLFATIGSGRLAVEAIKLAVTRPRPPLADRLEEVTSWSFPSSHSAGTMLTCLAFAMASGQRGAPAAGISVAILIGWTRLALGVHWPGDVLAGWGFALVWLGMATRFAPAPDLLAVKSPMSSPRP